MKPLTFIPNVSHQSVIVMMACFMLTLFPLCLSSEEKEEASKPKPRAIAVIVNKSNPLNEISKFDLKRIFLKQRTFWGPGKRCVPINQSAAQDIRQTFSDLVLNKEVQAMKRYWMQQTMTGSAKPPVVLDSSATVKKYIERIAGGIGYIYKDEIDDSIKAIGVKGLSEIYVPPPPGSSTDENAIDDGERGPGSGKAPKRKN